MGQIAYYVDFKNKFYCNIAMPTHLCIICDRFHTTAAELSRLSNYNRDHMATEPKLFSFDPLQKKWANP